MSKMTVSELLRIRNELHRTSSSLQMKLRNAEWGVFETEEGQKLNSTDGQKADVVLEKFFTCLELTGIVEGILVVYNGEHEIPQIVAEIKRIQQLINVLATAVENSRVKSKVERVPLSDEVITYNYVFKPHLQVENLKSALKDCRVKVRQLQAKLDTLNAQTVEVPFTYEDVEKLAL